MAGTGAEKHAPPVTDVEGFQLHLASPPRNQSCSTGLLNTVNGVSCRRQAGVGDFATIVRRSYSGGCGRLVLWLTKRTSARPVNLKSPVFKSGAIYLEAERE
jgi:hypothetical protein